MVDEAVRGGGSDPAVNENERRQRELVDSIRMRAAHVAQIVAKGREPFLDPANWVDRSAARNEVVEMSEAAGVLPTAFRERNPKVPWDRLVNLRRRMVHYLSPGLEPVEDAELWRFISEDALRIERELRRPIHLRDSRRR